MNPTQQEIIDLRTKIQDEMNLGIGAAQQFCASLIHKKLRTWQQWEKGDRKMDIAFMELLRIKLKKH